MGLSCKFSLKPIGFGHGLMPLHGPGHQYKPLPNLCILRLASNEVASLASDGKKNAMKRLECVAIIIRASGHTSFIHIYPHSTCSLSDIWSTLLASRLSCFHLHDLWKPHAWTCQTNPDSRWCRNDWKYHSSLITFLTTTYNNHKSPSIPSIPKYSIDCQGRGRPSRIRSVTPLSDSLEWPTWTVQPPAAFHSWP